MTGPNELQSLQAQNKALRQALEDICKHQRCISGNEELIAGIALYKITGAWQIASKALESKDKLNESP